MSTLVVTDDTTREELLEALTNLCAGAKAMSRRGYIGTRSAEYARQHERIDAVLSDLLLST